MTRAANRPAASRRAANRYGVQLVEICVALAILAGPALYGLSLIQSSVRAARLDADRADATILLDDVLELIRSEPPAKFDTFCGDAGQPALRDLARRRLELIPGDANAPRHQALVALAGRLHAALERDAAGLPGTVQLSIFTDLERGGTVRVSRTIRTLAAAGTH